MSNLNVGIACLLLAVFTGSASLPVHAGGPGGVNLDGIILRCKPDPRDPSACNNLDRPGNLTALNLVLSDEGTPVDSAYFNSIVVVHGPDGSWIAFQTNGQGIPSPTISGPPGSYQGSTSGGSSGGGPGGGTGGTGFIPLDPGPGYCTKTVTTWPDGSKSTVIDCGET